jgi:hypothetical protein
LWGIFSSNQLNYIDSNMFENNESTKPKIKNTFQMQAFVHQLELLTGVMKDMKDEMTSMRQ